MDYGKHGTRLFDTTGSGTSAQSFELDLPDTTGNFSGIFVQISMKVNTDGARPQVKFVDPSGSLINLHYRVRNSGTNSTLMYQRTDVEQAMGLTYFTNGNDNSTTFETASMFSGFMFITYQKNTSAPISNIFGSWQATYGTTVANYHLADGTFYIPENEEIAKIRFDASSGTIKGRFRGFGILGNQAT